MRPFHDQSTATLPTSWLSRLRMGAVLVVLASAGAGGAVAQEGIDPPSAVLSPPTSYRSLSLRQAIELALINNRTLEKAGLDRGVQRFDLKVAEDEFVPNLDLVTSVQHNPITIAGSRTETDTGIITPVVSQRIPTGARFGVAWDNLATDNSAQPDTVYGSNVFLEFEQPLLRGAGFRANLAGLRIARLSEKSNLQEFRRLVINTITNVVFAYRSLQQAQRQVEVSESAVARAREQLRINRALVSSGIIPPVEIIQTEADIANQEFDLLTAQSVRDSSRLALVRLLDVERDSYFVAVEQITLPEFIPNLERCRRLAFENRPDYRQILTGKAISDLAVDVAKNNQLWSLNLNSRYRIAGDDIRYSEAVDRSFSRYNEDWAVGLTL
ncbi:MAG: TolC family protein, partial [Rariglobus sp.]